MNDRRWLHLGAVVCVVLVCLPVLSGNWVGGHEGYSYLWRTAEVRAQLATGTLWPRWCPDFYWGHGYPFFVFYPPGVFLLGSVLGSLTPGLWWGLGLAAAIGCLAFYYGTWRWARARALGTGASVVAAFLASLATYRFVQLWVRGDYAESVATGIIPWVLAEAQLLTRGGAERTSYVAAGARLSMLLALVCFTHTLTAVMTCGALAVMGLWAARHEGEALLRVGVPSVAGLVLSAAYWLPVAAHASLVRFGDMVNTVEGTVSYHWGDHFPTLWQRISPAFGFGDSVPGPGDGMPMSTNLLGWGLVLAAAWLCREPADRARLLPLLLGWGAVQTLLLPISTPLWQWVPGLRMFQFPWRFLVLDALLVAGVGATVADLVGDRLRARTLLPALAILLAAPISFQTWSHAADEPYPLGPIGRATLEAPEGLQTLGAFTNAGQHVPITTAGRNEYLPRTVSEPPHQHPASQGAPALPLDLGPAREQIGAWRRWQVRIPEAGRYEVSWFYFPGVRASVDGVEVEIGRTEGRGVVALNLAAGERVVDVWYEGTGAMRVGAAIGTLGWMLAVGLLGWTRRKPPQTEPDAKQRELR